MTDISHQKSLTNGKGWKFVKELWLKIKKSKLQLKLKHIMGGIKAAPKLIKRELNK